MPDKTNLLMLPITNEPEDRTMKNYSQRDNQGEAISTLQAHTSISNELTLSIYVAASIDQKNNRFYLQQMNLGNNTAELLQNLSVIIAQRVALLKHNKNTDSQLQVAGKLDTPTPQIQKPSTEGIFHPEAKYFD